MRGSQLIGLMRMTRHRLAVALNVRVAVSGKLLDGGVQRVHHAGEVTAKKAPAEASAPLIYRSWMSATCSGPMPFGKSSTFDHGRPISSWPSRTSSASSAEQCSAPCQQLLALQGNGEA